MNDVVQSNTTILPTSSGNSEKESLQVVASNLQLAIKTGSEDAYRAIDAELKRRSGLFGIMFPGKILKKNEELAVDNMKDIYKTRKDLLQAYVNVQLELIRNEGKMVIKSKLQGYEGELSRQAMKIRSELSAYAHRTLEEMRLVFDESAKSFAKDIDAQLQEAKKYEHINFLHDRWKKNLETQADTFFAIIDQQVADFKEAFKDKIS